DRGVRLPRVRTDIHPGCRAGRASQSCARRGGPFGPSDEAQGEQWARIERETWFGGEQAEGRIVDSPTRARRYERDRPRRAPEGAVPGWAAAPRRSAPRR